MEYDTAVSSRQKHSQVDGFSKHCVRLKKGRKRGERRRRRRRRQGGQREKEEGREGGREGKRMRSTLSFHLPKLKTHKALCMLQAHPCVKTSFTERKFPGR